MDNNIRNPLADLLGEAQLPTGGSCWQRLDMEGVAQRLIAVARLAAAEHSMARLQDAIRRRGQTSATPAAGGANTSDNGKLIA